MEEYIKEIDDENQYLSKEIPIDVDNMKEMNSPLKKNSTHQLRNTVKIITYNFFSQPTPVNTNVNDYKDERLNDFI